MTSVAGPATAPPLHTLLITGTSHVGKSSLAAAIAAATGWQIRATDAMARHPGRPWPTTPAHVAEFYANLSPDSHFQFLLHHHENMWPGIRAALPASARVIWEGSALRPEYLARLTAPGTLALCLYAPPEILRQRIHASAGYADLSPSHRHLVDAFLERSLRDNTAQTQAASAARIACIDTSRTGALEAARDDLLAQLQGQTTTAPDPRS